MLLVKLKNLMQYLNVASGIIAFVACASLWFLPHFVIGIGGRHHGIITIMVVASCFAIANFFGVVSKKIWLKWMYSPLFTLPIIVYSFYYLYGHNLQSFFA